MRFVLGNRLMTLAGGTEVHLVTIGAELMRLGHEVVVYSPELGPYADHARRRGLEVTDELRRLPAECDVVFAQDALVVYDLVERYPEAVSVFRVCGDVYDFQSPPQLGGIVDLVVVLSERYARLAEACSVRAPVLHLPVPVDLERLVPLGPLRRKPSRAVVLGNYPQRVETIRAAWEPLGVEVRHVGAPNQQYDIASAVADADIVVAKARAAVDALACGRALYVYDFFGGDGWVTPETYPRLEADNFAGLATGRTVGVAQLRRDLADYDPSMGVANRDLAVQHHGARDHVARLLSAVGAAGAQERPSAPLREVARLPALQWSWEGVARESRHAQAVLASRLADVEQGAVESAAGAERRAAESVALAGRRTAEVIALRARLDAIERSRAWRSASLYWRFRDRLRRGGPAPDHSDDASLPPTPSPARQTVT